MYFNYEYRVTYANGQTSTSSELIATVNVTEDQYRLIAHGIARGLGFDEIEGIEGVVEEMRDNVRSMDPYRTLSGSLRQTPLKNPRIIKTIEVYPSVEDRRRFAMFKDHIDDPEERMTIYRSDGSSVEISCNIGVVTIKDSRKKSEYSQMSADHFLSFIR